MMLSYRQTAAVLVAIPAGLLAYAYYLQFAQGEEPCPLCITQRICFFLVGLFALLSMFKYRSRIWQSLSNALISLSAIVGLIVAGRQLWLQSLPEDQVPACGPGFNYIVQNFPLSEAISIMFRGNGNCAEVGWTFLSLSIAGWAFIFFTLLLLGALLQISRKVD